MVFKPPAPGKRQHFTRTNKKQVKWLRINENLPNQTTMFRNPPNPPPLSPTVPPHGELQPLHREPNQMDKAHYQNVCTYGEIGR